MEPVTYELFGRDTWRDPFALYARLRDEDPVHFSENLGIWVLSRFADVYAASLDATRFSSARGISLQNEREKLPLFPTMVMMDPPDHTANRRRVNRSLAPANVRLIEPALRAFVASCIERLREEQSADLVAVVARPVPCFVVAHYLGVPEEDRALFARWTQAIVQANVGGHAYGAGDALRELYDYFSELIAKRRDDPADDMISVLAHRGSDGVRLSTEEILGYAFVMIAGGNDTATGLIAGAAELLTEHLAQRRILLDDPASVRGAVDELLRLTTPVQGLCRVTQTEVAVGDVVIPGDSRVLLCYGAANRDPREFGPDAECLDVSRKVGRQLAFGSGVHHCLGSHAARLQGRVVVEQLLAAFPRFAVDADSGTFADGAFVRRYESLPFFAEAL
ncbi:MAG: cytochrome P450 [Acidimicrobiales bacterium]